MANYSFVSFVIGLLVGSIVVLLVTWAVYISRSFVFSYCPTKAVMCSSSDFFNNPSDALANGSNINDILFLNDQNIMYYKRVPRVSTCTVEGNSVVQILYPQFCSFSTSSGISGTWEDSSYGSNIYKPANGQVGPTITTTGNCQPVVGSPVSSGKPLLQWTPSPAAF